MNETIQAVAQAAVGPAAEGFNWDGAFPALIGFTGVLVGGIINVVAQRRNFNEEQVAIIRERVAEFAAGISKYISSAQQADQILRTKAVGTSNEGVIALDAHSLALHAKIGDRFFDYYRDMDALSIRLMSARDKKVANHAQLIQDEMGEFHSAFADLFVYKINHSERSLVEKRNKLTALCNEMLTMIGPRWYESFWRVRTGSTAKKQIKEHLEKKARKAEKQEKVFSGGRTSAGKGNFDERK